MKKTKIGVRKLKKLVLDSLKGNDIHRNLNNLSLFPPRQVVNPLIQLLNSTEELIKWRAVTALGCIVSDLADKNLESARDIMRRLMWRLNSESGGIGWGSAEAMGEIMAQNETLANEYASILLSYIDTGENYIENENLQKGVLWALGRLAREKPEHLDKGAFLLIPFLDSPDSHLRGLAAWTAYALDSVATNTRLKKMREDTESLTIYLNHRLIVCQIKDVAIGTCR